VEFTAKPARRFSMVVWPQCVRRLKFQD